MIFVLYWLNLIKTCHKNLGFKSDKTIDLNSEKYLNHGKQFVIYNQNLMDKKYVLMTVIVMY